MENILDEIQQPVDLHRLSPAQLKQLAGEIRSLIIDTVANNGGHLAPSLGTVDLTLAMYSVFNPAEDKVVWDVGHQAYGHKILTGRRDVFCTNRKLHGIRPFPTPLESEYDTFA